MNKVTTTTTATDITLFTFEEVAAVMTLVEWAAEYVPYCQPEMAVSYGALVCRLHFGGMDACLPATEDAVETIIHNSIAYNWEQGHAVKARMATRGGDA